MSERRHPKKCKVCGVTATETGHITASGLCLDHAIQRAAENHLQLRAHRGPYFEHWRRRCLAAFGVVVDTDE